MDDLLTNPIFWAAFALVSELVGASALKQNGVVALVLDSIKKLKPKSSNNG
tara:strand:- start:13878 stop:14030 length:153 start_codon:yes stop_codon:yes gene_type:complete